MSHVSQNITGHLSPMPTYTATATDLTTANFPSMHIAQSRLIHKNRTKNTVVD